MTNVKNNKKIVHFVIFVKHYNQCLPVLNAVCFYSNELIIQCYIFILGKQKCLSKTGDCLIRHGAVHATGLQLVVKWVNQD